MEHYVGLDVSLKRTSICVVNHAKRNGLRKAKVAVARKLAVILHRMWRTHLSLNNDPPVSCPLQSISRIFPRPILGGLHHH
jgi:hypothetical protein